MTTDHMTAAEAERRLDSVLLLGGTEEERRFAIRRLKAAEMRESAQRRATHQPDAAKPKIAKAIR
jgi:hypothetical protein